MASNDFSASRPSSSRTTIISAPGKVLLTGGYLVLDPAYTGTVVATTSRFYTYISNKKLEPLEAEEDALERGDIRRIIVRSPQFQGATWEYALAIRDSKGKGKDNVKVHPVFTSTAKERNKFVELALKKTMLLIQSFVGLEGIESSLDDGDGLEIEIVGDNDFYSQRQTLDSLSLPPTLQSLSSLPAFNSLPTSLSKVHKTGLGSSAALITSLVSSLLIHFNIVSPHSLTYISIPSTDSNSQDSSLPPVPLPEEIALETIHNAAQYIHCLAQGKIGSGFDVSSAVFGSQVYRRFGVEVLGELMEDRGGEEAVNLEHFKRTILPSPSWTNTHTPIALPPQVRLILADVDAGSDTPSLVGKVLKWRKENANEAHLLWQNLSTLNTRFGGLLSSLSILAAKHPETYPLVVSRLAELPGLKTDAAPHRIPGNEYGHGEIEEKFADLRKIMLEIRKGMKQMGEKSGVPIEPDEQTELLDACVSLPGVIGGGVPGAGGYDALYLLVLDDPTQKNTISNIESLWQRWRGLSVCPLDCEADRGGLKIYGGIQEIKGLKQAIERNGV